MIALLVCDDSSMARKQLIRALPEDWPVVITQASNGQEAVQAVRDGLAEVMFLDLTMPVMDGYQVLTALAHEHLSSRVIVVSGDIQEQAQQRVQDLGALAFIKKPATSETIRQTLLRLGLYKATQPPPQTTGYTASEPPSTLKVNFRDALREVTNVAMGRAAALLADVLEVFVELPVPSVNLLEVSELHMALADAQRGEQFCALCQGFIGDGIAGEALLLFHDSELSEIARLLRWGQGDEKQTIEMLLDLSSILIGACLKGISEQIDVRFSQGNPQLLGLHSPITELIRVNQRRWKRTLAVEISYSLENKPIHVDLLLLFTEDSVQRLSDKINYMLL